MTDRERSRDSRRLLLAGLAGMLGGALLVRRSAVWLALGAVGGLLVGRRLRDGERSGREDRGAPSEDSS